MRTPLSSLASVSSAGAQRGSIFAERISAGSDTRRRDIRRKAAQATAGGPAAQRPGQRVREMAGPQSERSELRIGVEDADCRDR
jgi:hypothetical protein